ncbi:MAG: cytochrome c biogenesis protein DipZ [Methanoregulaceae archaeon]
MTLLVFFAFLSGIVTILSPCILPVLPIVLTGSIGGKSKPFGVVTGFIASFSFFTLVLSALVQTLDIPVNTLRIVAVVIIVTFGLTMIVPRLHLVFDRLMSRLVGSRGSSQKNGFSGGFLTGVSLGLVWTPCVGPIMASVITLAVNQQVDGGAVLIIAAYSLGTAIPMFAVMVGGRKLLVRFPRLSAKGVGLQRVFGVIMIIAGLMIGVGADRRFQSFVLELFPNYGTGLTLFENSDSVREAIDSRRTETSGSELFTWENAPKSGVPGDYGKAPPIIAEGPWINSDHPLSLEDLQGKVVLIDFWTYSCVNCVRTIPYLRTWYEKYAAEGLVIIGVHTPEFPFERNEGNVKRAVRDLDVTWPVVLDNNFAQWNAYHNRYWPAHFFIDSTGRIRYFQFGEGSYEEAEKVIRALLAEAGSNLEEAPGNIPVPKETGRRTPEVYLGYERAKGFLSDALVPDKLTRFSLASDVKPGQWSLEGEWIIRNDFIEIDGSGKLELGFEGKDIFLVVEPRGSGSSVTVEIDGKLAGDTVDVQGGVLHPRESRLYHLASFGETGEHTLILSIEGHVRLYTFTFG